MADMLAPQGPYAMRQFGDGDREKLRNYLLMLAAFLDGKPVNTRRTYRCGLQQFFDLFDWVCPEKVTPAHVVAFKKWLLEHRGVSESTTYYRMSAVSSFFDYLCKPPSPNEEPLLRHNPFSVVPRNDIQPTPYGRAKAMEWEDFQTILATIPSTPIGMRDRAILLFYAFTSRRRAEVAGLRIRDLDLRARPRTYTTKVKGGATRTFELPDLCYDAIRAYWLAADRLHTLRADAGVFTPSDECVLTADLDPHRPLSNRSMNAILTRAIERTDLDPKDDSLCIHAIRHMTARDLHRAGVPLQDIQAMLDHASPTTTQLYLDRLSGPAPAHTDVLLRVRKEAADLARGIG